MKWMYLIFCVLTAMIGYSIHGNLFYSIINFIFTPISWLVWLICHDVTVSIIKETFSWFFN